MKQRKCSYNKKWCDKTQPAHNSIRKGWNPQPYKVVYNDTYCKRNTTKKQYFTSDFYGNFIEQVFFIISCK